MKVAVIGAGTMGSGIAQAFAQCAEVEKVYLCDIKEEFAAGFCDDGQTKATIHSVYETYSYTCDTHTAVAVKVYKDYKETSGDTTKTVIASTASPYKFSAAVLEALEGKASDIDEYDKVDKIAQIYLFLQLLQISETSLSVSVT